MTVTMPRPVTRRPGLLRAAAVGIPTAGVALGVAQIVAAALGRAQSAPVLAVGSAVIDATPRPLKEFAIRQFGTNDKLVLLSGVYLVLAWSRSDWGRWRCGAASSGSSAWPRSWVSVSRPSSAGRCRPWSTRCPPSWAV
jgi:hypothetical protein